MSSRATPKRREQDAAYRRSTRGKATRAAWRAGEGGDRHRVYMRAYNARRAAEFRDARLQKAYGITTAMYDAILEYQGGGCALCGARAKSRRLPVDHDHETDEVRGILCAGCNTGLGKLGDTEAGLLRALAYVRGEL